MGKSQKPPPPPDMVAPAIATANSGKYDEVTPDGTVSWSLRPGADPRNPQPGDYIRTTNLSETQKQIYNQNNYNTATLGTQVANLVRNIGPDDDARERLQDQLYNRSTKYYGEQFGNQEADMRSRLANQGLTEGSEAYNREISDFNNRRDDAYGTAASTASLQAEQQSQSNQTQQMQRVMQALAAARGQTPTSQNSAGGAPVDFSSATQNAYNQQVGNVNAANANRQQNTSAGAGLAGAALLAFL